MKINVDILFSKNNKIGSKAIQWGTKHQYNLPTTPSHVAILIKDRWVLESTLFTGVRVIPYKEWKKINKELHRFNYSKIEYSIIKNIFKKIQGKKYDWLGVTYLALKLIMNKFFKKRIPQENKWESSDKYFCSEATAELIGLKNHSMKTPVDMMVWTDYLLR